MNVVSNICQETDHQELTNMNIVLIVYRSWMSKEDLWTKLRAIFRTVLLMWLYLVIEGYPVSDFPIGLVGWSEGPQHLGGLWPRCMIFFSLDLSYTCCHKANKSTLALISMLILSFHKSSEIDKLKKQGVVRHQICFDIVVNFR
jgi:hypothetical protein